MTLKKWEQAVKLAKIKLKMNPKKFTRIDGELLKEAQAIYSILLISKSKWWIEILLNFVARTQPTDRVSKYNQTSYSRNTRYWVQQ